MLNPLSDACQAIQRSLVSSSSVASQLCSAELPSGDHLGLRLLQQPTRYISVLICLSQCVHRHLCVDVRGAAKQKDQRGVDPSHQEQRDDHEVHQDVGDQRHRGI